MTEKFAIYEVQLKPIILPESGELSDNIIRKCNFCGKNCNYNQDQIKILQKLTEDNEFFCNFCIRNRFNTKLNKDVLIFSFRNIIEYFYSQKYLNGIDDRMYLSEIDDAIKLHQQVGLLNPIFFYDPESFLWFVNFAKVGDGKKQISLDSVFETVFGIFSAFDIKDKINGLDATDYLAKYEDAMSAFAQKRFRPKDRQILSPTWKSQIKLKNNFVLDDLKFKN